ncbi:MAG: aldose epimerase [Cyanobacteriota bacterium]|nr:aldose epimerase [Cyanobacteriota bacterium]
MFSITTHQQQYTTYVLSDLFAQSQVEVVPERGGILTQWRIQDQELLYLDHERFTHPELTVRGGIPVLFPICGNLPNDTYHYQGKPYTLKQHGFARNLPWQVVDQDSDGVASLTVMLDSSQETLLYYPFEFTLALTYQLMGQTLTVRQHLTNRSEQPMPFVLGFHPYFAAPNKSQLKFGIPAKAFYDHLSQTSRPFDGSFDLTQPEIDVAFKQPSSQSATVSDPSLNRQLTLKYGDPYSTLVFWTVLGKDFYCLEPWTAPRNALNTGEQLITLSSGESFESQFSLTVSLLNPSA